MISKSEKQDFFNKTLEIFKAKRLLTDKELDHYLQLQTDQSKKKYLEGLKDELWQTIEKKS